MTITPEQYLKQMETAVAVLADLIKHPQPGLTVWHQSLHNAVKRINAIHDTPVRAG